MYACYSSHSILFGQCMLPSLRQAINLVTNLVSVFATSFATSTQRVKEIAVVRDGTYSLVLYAGLG